MRSLRSSSRLNSRTFNDPDFAVAFQSTCRAESSGMYSRMRYKSDSPPPPKLSPSPPHAPPVAKFQTIRRPGQSADTPESRAPAPPRASWSERQMETACPAQSSIPYTVRAAQKATANRPATPLSPANKGSTPSPQKFLAPRAPHRSASLSSPASAPTVFPAPGSTETRRLSAPTSIACESFFPCASASLEWKMPVVIAADCAPQIAPPPAIRQKRVPAIADLSPVSAQQE